MKRSSDSRKQPQDIKNSVRHESSDSASSLPSSYTTAATSGSEPAEEFDDFINNAKGKAVRWKDSVPGNDLTESKQRSARASDINIYAIIQLLDEDLGLPLGIDTTFQPTTPSYKRSKSENKSSAIDISKPGLIPSSVALPPKLSIDLSPIPISYVDPQIIRPFYSLTANEQKVRLIKKIKKKFPDPTSILETDPRQAISRLSGTTDPKIGIHVFVDFSNIIIGFYNRLKAARNIHERAHVCHYRCQISSILS